MKKLIGALLAIFALNANAGMVQGHELLEWLESDDYRDNEIALLYIAGANDTFEFVGQAFEFEAYCAPKGKAPAQVFPQVVAKWLREHPEKQHFDSGSLVFNALAEAYPCSSEEA